MWQVSLILYCRIKITFLAFNKAQFAALLLNLLLALNPSFGSKRVSSVIIEHNKIKSAKIESKTKQKGGMLILSDPAYFGLLRPGGAAFSPSPVLLEGVTCSKMGPKSSSCKNL